MGTGNLNVGNKAIDFTLIEAGTKEPLTLSDFEGKQNVVLMFYRGLF